MFERLRATDPTQPLYNSMLYRFCRALLVAFIWLFYRPRFYGVENIPPAGALLVVSNHQSHLDPPLIGIGLGRRNMASIAREALFKIPIFGPLLRAVGAIPIKQEEGDAAAIRAAIGELKKGRLLLIFPEGTRTPDGAMHEFKRGTWLLLSRSGCSVLPAAVEGAFDAWPRSRRWPRLFGRRCAVAFGEVIEFQTLKPMGADAGLEFLARRIDALRLELRTKLRERTHGRLPTPGPGDLSHPHAAGS
jgi:1-acyl-sn-glycerol-3-phosphate acyltransferase